MNSGVGKARGVLRSAPGPGVFHHARLPPPPVLATVIQHFWIVRWDLRGCPAQTRETLPHPNAHLVLEAGQARVHGVHTGRFISVLEGQGVVFGVKFRPGGFRPFLREPLSALRNRSVSLRELFGAEGDRLGPAVLSQQDDAAMVAVAVDFLTPHLPPVGEEVERVGRIVDGIARDRSVNTLDDLVAQWRTGKRALQRIFNEYVGVGPKWVISRYRMHEALERMEQDDGLEWARLALELGYFDQAHFIRDFKALVGCPPAEYWRRYRDG
ncbi:helix-turn-helix domain-containing protein [Pseudoxanthomonas sp. CF125]|uniref:helix-turn-helix domain-containing protein n=1 Tax=Pseudoxanthomonas sp. CF125 TaxID=1855303 RepID=UPI00088AADF2|nr:helix-turn-helix domain-containing protein [Pseudoxanthomonas sp. CF125]SDQ26377.1 Helix-turn-helix domain-containing protein [Pseudoxanthomonas sp. CF125]